MGLDSMARGYTSFSTSFPSRLEPFLPLTKSLSGHSYKAPNHCGIQNPPSGHDVPMATKSENPWSLDLSTSFTILFGIFGLGVSLLNLYFAWEQLDHVRV